MNTSKKLDHIIDLMQRDDSVDAPADSVLWVKNLYRTRASEQKVGLMQRVKAVLNIELTPGKLVTGERSASVSAVRQMLFNAGDNAVDLRITKLQRGFSIKGQILGEGFDAGRAELRGTKGSIKESSIVDAAFEFKTVLSGKYSMSFISDSAEIEIEEIEV